MAYFLTILASKVFECSYIFYLSLLKLRNLILIVEREKIWKFGGNQKGIKVHTENLNFKSFKNCWKLSEIRGSTIIHRMIIILPFSSNKWPRDNRTKVKW